MTQKKRKKKPIWKRYKLVWPAKNENTGSGQTRRVVRRKLRLRKEAIYALLGIVALLCLIFIPRAVQSSNLKKLGYKKPEIQAIREQKLAKTVLDNQYYSPYLASSIVNKTLRTDYIKFYAGMRGDRTLSNDEFLLIQRLREKGYEDTQIINLLVNLKNWEITPLLVFDYQYNEQYYIDDCKSQTGNSPTNFELSGSYFTPYLDTHPVDDPSSIEKLVNKTYYLSEDFVPEQLTGLSNLYAAEGRELAGIAADPFKAMCEGGRSAGVTFYTTSAYRDYASQETVYNSYVTARGEDYANTYSAKAGFSEHQTGLAVDVAATNEDDKSEFKDTNAFRWLSMNCMNYGWIMRFPEGKALITGYDYEPWHYRYVGIDVAKAVYEKNLTYDEFYMLYLKPWEEGYKPADDILKATDFRTAAEPEATETPKAEESPKAS